MLEAAHARALHHLDHLWRVPLLPQPPRAGFTAVARANYHHSFGRIGERGIPGNPHHVVEESAVEFVLLLHIRGQFGGPRIHPLFPALPDQRTLQAIGAVHAAVEGIAFQAHARVMRECAAVPIEVFVRLVVVVLLRPA